MLNDAHILTQLKAELQPDELSAALKRLRVVPEVWRALHDAEFLTFVMGHPDEISWLPGEIADSCLMYKQDLAPDEEGATPGNESAGLSGLFDLASEAHALANEINLDLEDVVGRMQKAPATWRARLACAWIHIEDPSSLIEHMLACDDQPLTRLLLSVLFANYRTADLLEALSAHREKITQIMPLLMEMGEKEIALYLAESLRDEPAAHTEPSLHSTDMDAYAQAIGGDFDGAHLALSTAWASATESTARVADQLAQVARLEGNQAVELEARRKAVEEASNPMRRAALARAVVEADRGYEAAQLVSNPGSLEERIAHGMALLQQNLVEEARANLIQAKDEALQLGYSDIAWLGWMATGLDQCAQVPASIEIKTLLAQLHPQDAGLELELANLWARAGDPATAVLHAEMALALTPDSLEARKSLAKNLRSAGDPGRALGYLQQVVQDDPIARNEYCQCALESNEPDLAFEIASELIEQDPDNSRALILLAQAQHLKGDSDNARLAIERAIELDADDVKPWLVLAEIQSESGEHDAVGDTLQKAIELAPGSGAAHLARAHWLASMERFHEAAQHSTKALALNPESGAWLWDHASLLDKIGDSGGARRHLEKALNRQPKNWKIRQALALNLETSGEIETASALILELPEELDTTARIDAGRVLIKQGLTGEMDVLKKGLVLMASGEPDQEQRADYLYWSGRAYEKLGEPENAAGFLEQYLADYEHIPEHHTLDAVLAFARVSLELSKPEQAVTFLDQNRANYPGSMDIVNLLAEAYSNLGNTQKAFEIAQEAIDTNPASVDAHKLLSTTAEALGDIRTAIDAEEQILAQQPSLGSNWERMASLYAAIKDLPAARAHLARAIFIDRQDPQALHRMASSSCEFGLNDTQSRLMKRAAKLAPSDRKLQVDLAEIAESNGDHQTAYIAWMRCVEQDPGDAHALRQAARVISKTGRHQNAVALWEQALQIEPEDHESLALLAQAYERIGDPQIALSYYQRLIDLDIDDPAILRASARAHLRYGQRDRAQSLIERAITQYPADTEIQLLRVESLFQEGTGEKTLKAIEDCLAKTPTNAYALALAAKSAVLAGDPVRALAGLDEALHETHIPQEATRVLIEVCAALGEWRIHSTLVRSIADTGRADDRVALQVLLRARDLEFLYAEFLRIQTNKPDAKMIQSHLDRLHGEYSEADASTSPAMDVLLEWLDLNETPIDYENRDINALSWSARQELVQAIALALLKANRPSKALALLDANPAEGLHHGYHALISGIAAMKADQPARAKDMFDIASRSLATNASGAYLQAKQAYREQDLETAISAFNTALAICPDEASWHADLAHVYTKIDRIEAALPHLQQAVELEPQDQDYLIALARAYRAAGESMQAESFYARLLQDASSTAQIWKEAGEVALANGNAAQADSWFEKACSLAPSDAVCLMGSARAALLLGKQKLAIDRAQSAYTLAPNEPEVLTGFAEILSKQGKTEKALQAYDRAIKISAGDPHIQLARSRLLLDIGQHTDAINDIQLVLDAGYQDPEASALLAAAHEQAGHLDLALKTIGQALEESPREGTYRLTQARLYRKAGQLDQSLKVLRELERDEPDNADLASELGKVYEERRETDAALEAYLRAVAKNAKDIESCMRAGLILKGLKSYEHAATMFERVVTSRPNDAKALHQLAAVRALQLVHGGIETQVVTT
jgi:tetratricopeptide (TPR) repeat protein